MPDAGRTVGVTGRAAEHVHPEQVALHVLESLLHVSFVACLAHQGRHDGCFGVGRRERADRRADRILLAMTPSNHVVIDDQVIALLGRVCLRPSAR